MARDEKVAEVVDVANLLKREVLQLKVDGLPPLSLQTAQHWRLRMNAMGGQNLQLLCHLW